MTHKEQTAAAIFPGRTFASLALLWLCGACLRISILAVPPVIPLLHADLSLTATGVGLLSSFPTLSFSLAAIPGALLISRFGLKAALLVGLLLNAAGSAARGFAPDVAFLYVSTILMSAGVAIMQPAMPPLVRRWFPRRIGLATAIYTNGLVVGETTVVGLTSPFLLPLLNNDWRLVFLAWTLPVLATALFVAADRRDMRPVEQTLVTERTPWWPDWRSPLIWRLGLLFGSVNAAYFIANAFLPDYLLSKGTPGLIGPALTALNLSQLPASIVMLFLAGHLAGRPHAYFGAGCLSFFSLIGIICVQGVGIVIFAGLLGFALAVLLILVLALPSILGEPQEIHLISAGMFTISYGSATVLSILTGALCDWTRLPVMGFIPIALYALLALPFTLTINKGSNAKKPALD